MLELDVDEAPAMVDDGRIADAGTRAECDELVAIAR